MGESLVVPEVDVVATEQDAGRVTGDQVDR